MNKHKEVFLDLLTTFNNTIGGMSKNYLSFYFDQLQLFNKVILVFLVMFVTSTSGALLYTVLSFFKENKYIKEITIIIHGIIMIIVAIGLCFWSLLGCYLAVSKKGNNVIYYYTNMLQKENADLVDFCLHNIVSEGSLWTYITGNNYNEVESLLGIISNLTSIKNNNYISKEKDNTYLQQLRCSVNKIFNNVQSLRNSDGTTLSEVITNVNSQRCGSVSLTDKVLQIQSCDSEDGPNDCKNRCKYLKYVKKFLDDLREIVSEEELGKGFESIRNDLQFYYDQLYCAFDNLEKFNSNISDLPSDYNLKYIFDCTNLKQNLDIYNCQEPFPTNDNLIIYLLVTSLLIFVLLILSLYSIINRWNSCKYPSDCIIQSTAETNNVVVQHETGVVQTDSVKKLYETSLASPTQVEIKKSNSSSTTIQNNQNNINDENLILQSSAIYNKNVFKNDTQTPKKIKKINLHMEIKNVDLSTITSFIQLQNHKILCGTVKGTFIISSINYVQKQFRTELKLLSAHNDSITSLCEIKNCQIVSSSLDKLIKIWYLSETKLTLLTSLSKHTDCVFQILPLLNKNEFISCGGEGIIRIWNNTSPYKETYSINEDKAVYAVIELKHHKDMIITSCRNLRTDYACYIGLWDLIEYKQGKRNPKQLDFNSRVNSLIELNSNLVAAVTTKENCTIFLIHPIQLKTIKQIGIEGYDGGITRLSLFDNFSFLCVCNGAVTQITFWNGVEIIFDSKSRVEGFDGKNGIIVDSGYEFILGNEGNGFGVIGVKL